MVKVPFDLTISRRQRLFLILMMHRLRFFNKPATTSLTSNDPIFDRSRRFHFFKVQKLLLLVITNHIVFCTDRFGFFDELEILILGTHLVIFEIVTLVDFLDIQLEPFFDDDGW